MTRRSPRYRVSAEIPRLHRYLGRISVSRGKPGAHSRGGRLGGATSPRRAQTGGRRAPRRARRAARRDRARTPGREQRRRARPGGFDARVRSCPGVGARGRRAAAARRGRRCVRAARRRRVRRVRTVRGADRGRSARGQADGPALRRVPGSGRAVARLTPPRPRSDGAARQPSERFVSTLGTVVRVVDLLLGSLLVPTGTALTPSGETPCSSACSPRAATSTSDASPAPCVAEQVALLGAPRHRHRRRQRRVDPAHPTSR